ncbi:MAG: HAD-IIIA family hydrolase [Puniceicoccales bacterium]|jgi:D-glycero-D-manno-heptose 1,7-bisphosphate phosphatase|nr:HAD-IIIA family hydrolase [Puniceicoccales bacterium]
MCESFPALEREPKDGDVHISTAKKLIGRSFFPSVKNRALFFDRDNTLNENEGGYIFDPQKIILCAHAREILHAAYEAGYFIFLVTNQSGVGRGYFSMEDVHACNRQLVDLIGIPDVFSEICISTGTSENPDGYRKPSPKFLNEMFARHRLNPGHCWVIGDSECDMQMASNAGSRGLLLSKGGQPQPLKNSKKICLGHFPDLMMAWKFIQRIDG